MELVALLRKELCMLDILDKCDNDSVKKILNNYSFISGDFNTSFIEKNYPEVLTKK